jgi:hypothetical protein
VAYAARIMAAPALIFDIETIGDITPANRDALTQIAAESERSAEEYAALCPPLARVVCIVAYDLAADRLQAFYDATLARRDEGAAPAPRVVPGCELQAADGEADLLRRFDARAAQHMQQPQAHLVTFNGRGFDLPVLIHRSVKLGVPSLRKRLTEALAAPRQTPAPHIDLMDAFTFNGMTRRYSLAVYALGYGLGSPKDNMGGADVGPAVAAGRILDVVAYCAGDVLATADLYRVWFATASPSAEPPKIVAR